MSRPLARIAIITTGLGQAFTAAVCVVVRQDPRLSDVIDVTVSPVA